MKPVVLLVPVLGALTGWLIITLALKVLFRPVQPLKIPLWNTSFQGVIPNRQAQLAAATKEILEAQLLSAVTRENGLAPEILSSLTDSVAKGVRERTERKIPGLIPAALRDKIAGIVEEIVRKETPGLVDSVLDNLRSGNGNSTGICSMIEEKIKSYDVIKIEQNLIRSREVLYLKTGGAVLGLAAGFIQLFVVWMAFS